MPAKRPDPIAQEMGRRGAAAKWAKPGAHERARQLGRLAGLRLLETRGREYFARIGREGARRRREIRLLPKGGNQ